MYAKITIISSGNLERLGKMFASIITERNFVISASTIALQKDSFSG